MRIFLFQAGRVAWRGVVDVAAGVAGGLFLVAVMALPLVLA